MHKICRGFTYCLEICNAFTPPFYFMTVLLNKVKTHLTAEIKISKVYVEELK